MDLMTDRIVLHMNTPFSLHRSCQYKKYVLDPKVLKLLSKLSGPLESYLSKLKENERVAGYLESDVHKARYFASALRNKVN